jgi:hypothetical protein
VEMEQDQVDRDREQVREEDWVEEYPAGQAEEEEWEVAQQV